MVRALIPPHGGGSDKDSVNYQGRIDALPPEIVRGIDPFTGGPWRQNMTLPWPDASNSWKNDTAPLAPFLDYYETALTVKVVLSGFVDDAVESVFYCTSRAYRRPVGVAARPP